MAVVGYIIGLRSHDFGPRGGAGNTSSAGQQSEKFPSYCTGKDLVKHRRPIKTVLHHLQPIILATPDSSRYHHDPRIPLGADQVPGASTGTQRGTTRTPNQLDRASSATKIGTRCWICGGTRDSRELRGPLYHAHQREPPPRDHHQRAQAQSREVTAHSRGESRKPPPPTIPVEGRPGPLCPLFAAESRYHHHRVCTAVYSKGLQ